MNHSGRGFGWHHSEKTKLKMSESAKGRKMSDAARLKMSLSKRGVAPPWKGKHLSDQHKAKISEVHKGKETWMKGKHHTDASKKKISDADMKLEMHAILVHNGETHVNKWRETKPEVEMMNLLVSEHIPFMQQRHLNVTCADFFVELGSVSLAIYVDGCFFHCCKVHYPIATKELQKKNVERDRRKEKYLDSIGVRWIRFTQCQIEEDSNSVCRRLLYVLSGGLDDVRRE